MMDLIHPDVNSIPVSYTHLHRHLPPFENREDIFGQQLILDERDQLLGKEPYLLVNATDFSLMEIPGLVKSLSLIHI